MLIFHRTIFTMVIILFTTFFAAAQDSRYEAGINAGAYVYKGDLTPAALGSSHTVKAGVNLWAARILSNKFSLRLNLTAASLEGDEGVYDEPDWRKERNLKFSTPVTELTAMLVGNLPALGKLQPYAFAGVGIAFLNVKPDASGFNYAYFANRKDVTDGLAADLSRKPLRSMPVVPIGAGLRYPLGDKFSIHAETNYRLTSTDYLDGFSKVANPDRYDHFQSVSLGLIYNFKKGKDIGCPSFE